MQQHWAFAQQWITHVMDRESHGRRRGERGTIVNKGPSASLVSLYFIHIQKHTDTHRCTSYLFYLLLLFLTSVSVHPSYWGQILWFRPTSSSPASQLCYFFYERSLPVWICSQLSFCHVTSLISARWNWTDLSRSKSKAASFVKLYMITLLQSEFSLVVLGRITENAYCIDSKGSK